MWVFSFEFYYNNPNYNICKMPRSLAVSLYRSLLRQSRKIGKDQGSIYIQQSLDPQQEFGRFVYFDSEVYDKNICHNLLDTWPNQPMEELVVGGLTKTRGRWVTSDELKDITKKAFRDITPSSNAETNRLLDFGIDALREMQKLIIWRRQTTVKHNDESGVDVTCTTMLSPINNESNSSTFFYRITFENRGDDSIQLLGRHL